MLAALAAGFARIQATLDQALARLERRMRKK
jgi:hypothetical protein